MTKKQKKMLIRIVLSAVLMIVLRLLPIEGWLRFFLYLIPYLIIGYDILIKAGKGILRRQMFDENFLSMFPLFVDRVNGMMKEGSQYHIVKPGQMPVELRVLAVMRMGMTDSMQIARFMSYTISTVYTYRSRAAEKSKYSRDEFERRLMQIPLE